MKGYRLLTGLASSAAIAAGGWRAGALTSRGAGAATLVGTAVVAGTSWRGATLLAAFFVSGSALSKAGRQPEIVAKGGRRDERQVLANGGVAALAGAGATYLGEDTALVLLAGSLAAATSDTWATEIGSTSSEQPRMVISGRRVPAGMSGGVTARGTLASIAGATALGGLAAALLMGPIGRAPAARLGVAATLGGVTGSLLDSALGEVAQGKRWSPEFGVQVETGEYRGAATLPAGGLQWFDNDLVNACCTFAGALVAYLAWTQLGPDRATSGAARRAGGQALS